MSVPAEMPEPTPTPEVPDEEQQVLTDEEAAQLLAVQRLIGEDLAPTTRRGLAVHERIVYRLQRAGVDTGDRQGCWPWPGAINAVGKGVIGRRGERHVHVIMYEVLIGPVPAGMGLYPTCPGRSCANPWHWHLDRRVDNRTRARDGDGRELCRTGHAYRPNRRGECMTCLARAARVRRGADKSPGQRRP